MSKISLAEDVTIDKESLAQRIAVLELFSALPLNQINHIVSTAKLVDVVHGDMMFHDYDREHDFYLLLEGQIKLGVTSLQGAEKVVCLVGPGQSFGEECLFAQNSESHLCAQAILDSQVLLIPRGTIFAILDSNAMFARRLLTVLAERNCQLVKDIKYISLQNSTQRLISFFLQKNMGATNSGYIQLPASKQIIASMLNVTPETFSRSMLRLIKSGLIEVHGKEVLINDVAGLKAFNYL